MWVVSEEEEDGSPVEMMKLAMYWWELNQVEGEVVSTLSKESTLVWQMAWWMGPLNVGNERVG